MNSGASVPVPSFESLALEGLPVLVTPNVRAQAPRLARLGEEDAVLVYGLRGEGGPTLVSHRIRGLFSRDAPRVGPATVHLAKDNMNAMGPLVAWPDGSFVASYGRDWVLAATDEPGARATLGGRYAFDPASDAAWVLEPEGDRKRILRRAKRFGEGHVDDCGLLPKTFGFAAGVGGDGALFVAGLGQTPEAKIFVASREGLVTGATLTLPERARVSVLSRRGGAFLLASGHGVCVVHALDAEGQPCAPPWSLPIVSPHDHVVATSAWRGGVALAASRAGAGFGLVVTDGVSATFSPEAIRGVMSSNLLAGLAASADGRALAFAYVAADRAAKGGVFLARFGCAACDATSTFVPTAADLGRSIDSVPADPTGPGAPAAASPPPVRAAPLTRPSPFGTRDALVGLLRRLGLMCAFGQVRGVFGFDGDASGSQREGRFFCEDGQGNHLIVHWDATGIVALGFDHDSADSEWQKPLDLRDPGKHLPNVPPALAPLALRATDWGERLATEGMWIANGDPPAHGEAGKLEVLSRFLGPSGEVGSASHDLWDGLVARAEADGYVLTRADEAVIFATGRRPQRPLVVEDVEQAAAALARLGVTWPDAAVRAAAVRREEEKARSSGLPPADEALFRAAERGDLEGARDALASGAALEARLPDELLPYTIEGSTPLLVAMQWGRGDVAELLIARGADVEARVAASHGGGSALRMAAAQGDLRLFRLLRERGASVEPEVANWGLLQAVCYPRRHLPQGTPADYAEVIRLLLDAGAPLPNDAHCEELVPIVSAAGAVDLVPRLRRVYAEDALPALPLPIDPASAPRVSELLTQAAASMAEDNARSLRLLIEAWQLDPLPRIGEAAEKLALRVRGSGLSYVVPARGGIDGEATLRALREALAAPPDPRAAKAILGWLQAADIYTSRAALARCIDAAAALLVHARDVRCTEGLAQHCEQRPTGVGPTRESLRVALRALRETSPFPLDAAGDAALSEVEDRLAGRRVVPGRIGVRALFEAVYADPEDDAPRHVLADRLIEDGDPRGELIALQLARHAKGGKPSKREKELLADNGRAWLGEIAPILGDDGVFERGFLWQATTAERGNAGVAHTHPVLASGAGTQPEWSTVRRLSLWRHARIGAGSLLRGPRLHGLRALSDVGPADLRDLLGGPVRPLEQLELAYVRGLEFWGPHGGLIQEGLAEKLPGLVRLRLPSTTGSVDWIAHRVAGLPALRELSVALRRPALGELVALARARSLTRVRMLGPVDFAFEVGAGQLEVSFPGRLLPPLASHVAAIVRGAQSVGVRRVTARIPVRAKLVGEAPALAFERRSERLELSPLVAACEASGVPFAVEPHADDAFAPNPTRAE